MSSGHGSATVRWLQWNKVISARPNEFPRGWAHVNNYGTLMTCAGVTNKSEVAGGPGRRRFGLHEPICCRHVAAGTD